VINSLLTRFSQTTEAARPILVFALVANACGHAFFLISFPALGRTLGLSDTRAGMLMGLSALAMTLAAPLWGVLCERRGRRPVLLAGLVIATLMLAAITQLLMHYTDSLMAPASLFLMLLGFRVLGTTGTAAVMPSAQAWMADTTAPEQRVAGMGLLGAAFGIGSVLGSGVAMTAGIDNIWTGFAMVLGLLVLAVGLTARYLPEPERAATSEVSGQFSLSTILPCLLITLLGLAVYSLVQQVITLRLQDSFAMTPDQSVRFGGAAMMLCMLLMVVTQAWLLPKLGWLHGQILQRGAWLCLLALLLSLTPVTAVFLFAIPLLGLGFGLLVPANLGLLSLRSGPQSQARNAGINGVFQGLGMAVGPVSGASLQSLSPSYPWLAAVLLMLCVCLLGWHVARQSH